MRQGFVLVLWPQQQLANLADQAKVLHRVLLLAMQYSKYLLLRELQSPLLIYTVDRLEVIYAEGFYFQAICQLMVLRSTLIARLAQRKVDLCDQLLSDRHFGVLWVYRPIVALSLVKASEFLDLSLHTHWPGRSLVCYALCPCKA